MLFLGPTPAIQLTMRFEALMIDGVNRAVGTTRTASGKSINAARVARTLAPELDVMTTTGFAGGDTGRFLRADLERAGIGHDFVEVVPPTRTCVTVIDEQHRQATELVEESASLPACKYESLLNKLDTLLPGRRVLVVSGSLPPGAPVSFYAACCALARKHNVQTILDTRGKPLSEAMAQSPDLIKPNAHELSETLGLPMETESQIIAGARMLICQGAGRVVVTRGGAPVIACDARSAWRLSLPKVQAVSPIGSGDAFAGGLAVQLARGESFEQACIIAAACGVANAITPVSGHLDPADVRRLATEIHLEQMQGVQ